MIPPTIERDCEYIALEVEGSRDTINNAYNWCFDNFGVPGNRWFFMNNKFYFKQPKDLTWFELRW